MWENAKNLTQCDHINHIFIFPVFNLLNFKFLIGLTLMTFSWVLMICHSPDATQVNEPLTPLTKPPGPVQRLHTYILV